MLKPIGKSAGIVTTAHVAHATPAGVYAHSASRNWYCDSDLSNEAVTHKCKDISLQLIESSHNFQVCCQNNIFQISFSDKI